MHRGRLRHRHIPTEDASANCARYESPLAGCHTDRHEPFDGVSAVKLEDIRTNENIEKRNKALRGALRTCVEARAYMLTPANG